MEKSIEEFERIVLNIINSANQLKEYDYFGATAIISVVQLMLSKSEIFLKNYKNSSDYKLKIPQTIKEDVDAIVADLRSKLS